MEDIRTFEESWMSYISDDAVVSETAIVGAHDAGTYGADPVWETQHGTIAQQLYAGVRYFDLRATLNPETGNFCFVHADSNMPVFVNACGQSVETSLNAIKDFVVRNPQEVVIMDFQHTWTGTQERLVAFMEGILPMDKVLKKSDCDDPTKITFGEMREKGKNIIVIFKDGAGICDSFDWLFPRSEYLQSDYSGNDHKGTPERLVANWQDYFDAKQENVFFVLQAQLTGSPLEGRESLIRPLLNDYLKDDVAADEKKLAAVNIVMKDFIADDVEGCETTSKEAIHTILALNVDKGAVRADKLNEYKTACGYTG